LLALCLARRRSPKATTKSGGGSFLQKTPPLFIGEPTNAARAEGKLACIMPCKEEEGEANYEVRRGL